MILRFVSKRSDWNNSRIPVRLTKCQAMMRGRDASIKDREFYRKKCAETRG